MCYFQAHSEPGSGEAIGELTIVNSIRSVACTVSDTTGRQNRIDVHLNVTCEFEIIIEYVSL